MAMNSLPQGDLLLATSNGFAGAMVPSRSELFDMAISVAFGGSLRTAIILNGGHVGDEGQGRMLELLSNPAVMVELIKNANREQTLALADAYEKGDVNAIGKIRGEILAMMPLPGPAAVGNVSKVSKLTKLEQLAGKAADLQKVEKAADAALAAKVASGGSNATRIFTSTDPIVGKTATSINQALPGVVRDVNVPIKNSEFGLKSDADIMLKNGDVIEVKSGGGKGATTQVSNQTKIIGNSGEVIVYGPDLKPSVIKGIQNSGTKVFTKFDDLVAYIKSKGL